MPKTLMDPNALRLQKLGKRIREWRLRTGLSQAALGGKIGLHSKYICHIERGVRNITLTRLDALAKALGTTISKLTIDMR